MILKRIKLENIRSYENAEITFPEGSTLLSGDIGSGKTSILLAVEFALFGLQPGQRGSALLASNKDFGYVSLDFEIEQIPINIERRLKRTQKSVNQEYASLTIDGEKIESSVTEIKSRILSLLNYPDEFLKKNNILYKYTVYTPQEQMKQIILDDPESRLDSLRFIFGVDKYKRIKDNLSILCSKLREESKLLQVEVRSIDEIKQNISVKEIVIRDLSQLIREKLSMLKAASTLRQGREEEVAELEQKVKEKEKFLQEVEKSKILLSTKAERLLSEELIIKELESKIKESDFRFDESSYASIVEQIKMKILGVEELNKNYLSISSKINSFDIIRKENLAKKDKIFKIDICPTCLQDVSENHKHNIMNEAEAKINSLEKEKEELLKQKSDLELLVSSEKKGLLALEDKKRELELTKLRLEGTKASKEKLEIYRKSRDSLIKDVEFLNSHIKTLKDSAIEFTKFDNLLKVKQQELKESIFSEKKTEIEVAELKKESELTNKEVVSLSQKLIELEKINERVIKLIELEQWLSEDFLKLINFTEKNILYKLRAEFSRLFNKWFSLLTTDAFYVQLDENFTPIITQGDFELDYSYLSGGERTAVALAYRLALNQILNSILSQIKTQGLIILDEPTDGFSDQQLDKIRDILQELNAQQLILVSHEQKMESFVDNIIRLKKDGGLSKATQ